MALLCLINFSCTVKSDHTILRNDTSKTIWVEVVPPKEGFSLRFDSVKYLRADSLLIQRRVVYWWSGMAYAYGTLDTVQKLDYPGEDTSIVVIGSPRPVREQFVAAQSTDSLLVFALFPGGDFSVGSGPHRWIRWGAQVPVFWKEIRLLDQDRRVLWTYSRRNLRRLFRTRVTSTFRSGGTVSIIHYIFHWLPES